MVKFKLTPDPWDALELELSQMATLAKMLVSYSAIEDHEYVDYCTERLPEHVERARAAYYELFAARPRPPAPEEPTRPPLTPAQRRNLIAILDGGARRKHA